MISRPLLIIHASLTLLLPFVLALLITGCDGTLFGSKNTEQSTNFGPETSNLEILDAIDNVFAQYDPNTMKVGEWAQLDQTQQLNGETFLISDMAQNIVSRDEDDTSVTFHVTENRRYFDRQLNVTNQVDTEFPVTFKKSSPPPAASQASIEEVTPQKLGDPFYRIQQTAQEMSSRGSDGTMTLHNLETSMSVGAPPPAVASSADCAKTFPNCQIRIYKIAYDMVFWQNGKGEKLHREYQISPDAPLLGAILTECLTGVVPVENQRILVKECTTAKNFKFGATP